jgi:WD40 repeat protein
MLIYSPDGRLTARYTAYENGLGIKTAAWSPSGQFLAIGSFDQTVRVLNHLTWRPFGEFIHTPTVKPSAAIFREVQEERRVVLGENTEGLMNGVQFREAAEAAADAQGAREVRRSVPFL